MNCQSILGGLLLGAALAASAAQAPSAERFPEDEVAGFITPRDVDDKYCNIPVPVAGSGVIRQYDFAAEDSPCTGLNNRARSISFDGLPSATQILLTDSTTCSTDGTETTVGKFWVKLKTTRKITLTDAMQMSYFFGMPNDAVIHPGLVLVDKFLDGSSTDALNALSCVRITTSRATLPKPTVPVSVTEQNTEWVDWDDGMVYHCGGNRLLLGRAHFGDEEEPTEFRCGKPMQGSTAITLKNSRRSDEQEEFNHYYVCPPNTVLSGLDHTGDERGEVRYTCTEAWAGDTPLYVLPDDSRSAALDENHHRFQCPGNKVLIGRAHYHDENGQTWYQCGTLYQQSPR